MPKIKNTPEPTPSFIPLVAATSSLSLIGRIVSINLTKETFFGAGPIWLTPVNYFAEIPPDLSRDDMDRIQAALNSGILVEGKKYTAPVQQDPATLKKYRNYIRSNRPTEDKKFMQDLRAAIKNRGEGGFTAQEIIRDMTRTEIADRNRSEVVRFLNNAIMLCEGSEQAFPEPDHDNPGIKVLAEISG